MSLTAPQQAILRDGHPHTSRFFLSVLKPTQVYCGTISGSPSKGDRTLTMVDVSGSIASLVEGMTLYVGTSEGDKSIAKRRYRSRASQVIKVDESATKWAAGQYVTAYKNWELWGVLPYITDSKPFTFYKDRDIAYSDQNDHIPPVAIAGGPYIGFLDGSSITFTLDASKSYPIAVGATIVSYAWTCDGGTIANAAIAITTITFTAANANGYWLTLTVTDSNGKTQIIRTPIFVHERSGSNVPITGFAITGDLQGDWKSGGYNLSMEMWDKSVIDNILEGAYCILWKESTYAGAEHYYGNNGNIQFAGYVKSESVIRNPQSGTVTFELVTINGVLDGIGMPSVSLEESSKTAAWYRFPKRTLTVARAIHHLWKWHSTLFSIADVFLPIELTDTMPACDDFENGSLYSMVDNFSYEYSVFSKVCCDIAGRVYVEHDINVLSAAERSAKDTVMTLEDVDRRLDTDVTFTRNSQKVACVVASGIYLDGTTYKPVMSACPGQMYADIGIDVTNIERQVLHDQDYANMLSGRLFSIANQEVLEVNMSLAGDYPVELVPQVWWHLKDMDTKRADVNIDDINAVCRHITFKIDILSGTVYPDILLEPEAVDLVGDGETVVPPKDPTIDTPDDTPDPIIPIPPPPFTYVTVGNFNWSFPIYNFGGGLIGAIKVPFNCTIQLVELFTDPAVAGNIVLDIWRCTYAQIANGVHPLVADSIIGSNAKPTLSSANKSSTNIAGWIVNLYAGDILYIYEVSASGLAWVTLAVSGLAYV